MDDLTIRGMQQAVDDWVQANAGGYWEPLAILARLVEEVGETARLVNHLHGPKRKKADEPAQDLGQELADILYTVVCLANREGIDLQASFAAMMAKLEARDAQRFAGEDH
ncbi:MAG: nucleotide pyrophosphohydrolase [Anaerolineae bacterium]